MAGLLFLVVHAARRLRVERLAASPPLGALKLAWQTLEPPSSGQGAVRMSVMRAANVGFSFALTGSRAIHVSAC